MADAKKILNADFRRARGSEEIFVCSPLLSSHGAEWFFAKSVELIPRFAAGADPFITRIGLQILQ